MKAYLVTATVTDELCLADRHGGGNEYASLDYIPGTAWWGMMASLTGIRPRNEPGEDFLRVFYSGEVVFTNLYSFREVENERARPIPLSARTSKTAPGFKPSERILWGTEQYPDGATDWLVNGPDDDVDREVLRGWYVFDPPNSMAVAVEMTTRGQNEKSERSGVTSEGQLFTKQSIARGQQFRGALRCLTDTGEASLVRILGSYISAPLEVSLGRKPGRIRLDWQEIRDEILDWQAEPDITSDTGDIGGQITVTLLSDAIVVDRWLRGMPFVPAELVARELGLAPEAVRRLRHFSAMREVYGWNGAYSRPRETELVLAAGSAFMYELSWPDDVTVEERTRRLANWQATGIGLRTAEGYGEFRVNDPFHHVEWKFGTN